MELNRKHRIKKSNHGHAEAKNRKETAVNLVFTTRTLGFVPLISCLVHPNLVYVIHTICLI